MLGSKTEVRMPQKQLVIGYCALRAAYAVGLLAAPRRVASPWLGDLSEASSLIAVRGLGIRDLALCIGATVATASDAPATSWLALCTVSDAVDLAATVLTHSHELPPRSRAGTVLAAGSFGLAAAGLAQRQRNAAWHLG